MKRSLVLSTDAFLPQIDIARRAESAGFHRVWTTESTARDALVRALTIGLSTRTIEVATGIAYAFTRAPLATAAAAADVQVATGGRFALGLGAGTKGMRTRRYDIHDFDHPGPRMTDYIGVLRAAWSATAPFRYEGRFYTADVPTPFAGTEFAALPAPPVFGSGVNRRMLECATASCDGVALHPLVWSFPYLDRVGVPATTRRDGSRPWIATWVITSIHDDIEVARQQARRNLAFYFTTPSYRSVVEGTRWELPIADLRDTFRARPGTSPGDLSHLVPEDMVDAFALVSTPVDLPAASARLEGELAERGVTEIVHQVAGSGLDGEQFAAACAAVIDPLAAPVGAAP